MILLLLFPIAAFTSSKGMLNIRLGMGKELSGNFQHVLEGQTDGIYSPEKVLTGSVLFRQTEKSLISINFEHYSIYGDIDEGSTSSVNNYYEGIGLSLYPLRNPAINPYINLSVTSQSTYAKESYGAAGGKIGFGVESHISNGFGAYLEFVHFITFWGDLQTNLGIGVLGAQYSFDL